MKIVIACFAFVLTASLCFAQNSVWRVLKSNDTTAAEVLDNGNMAVAGTLTAAGTAVASVSVTPQIRSDTNASTTVTLYIPSKAGDMLIGKEGGSNRIWFATGATTNSWTIKLQ
jgi:hypothetical protein